MSEYIHKSHNTPRCLRRGSLFVYGSEDEEKIRKYVKGQETREQAVEMTQRRLFDE
jgi:hypothetical protein